MTILTKKVIIIIKIKIDAKCNEILLIKIDINIEIFEKKIIIFIFFNSKNIKI